MKKKKNTADEVSAQKIKYRHATLSVSMLESNSGQIDGLPRNPRLIKGDKFKALRKSVGDDPDMMEIRPVVVVPHGDKYVILGGNMRTEAARANGQDAVPCIVIDENTPLEWMREFVIKDNGDFGEWDWDMLANEWDDMDFATLGVDVPAEFGLNPDEFGNEFSLPDGDKSNIVTVSLMMSNEQAEKVKQAFKDAQTLEEFKHMDTYGNSNASGNAAYFIISQWVDARK